jgi:hypothetical protein
MNDSLVRWVLWSKQRAVVSHDSAAAAYGLGLLNPARVHLSVPPGFRMRDPAVVLHHRQLDDTDVAVVDGAPVTSVLRTVLDVIETHLDEELVEGVVGDALSSGGVTIKQLRRLDGLRDEQRNERFESCLGSGPEARPRPHGSRRLSARPRRLMPLFLRDRDQSVSPGSGWSTGP